MGAHARNNKGIRTHLKRGDKHRTPIGEAYSAPRFKPLVLARNAAAASKSFPNEFGNYHGRSREKTLGGVGRKLGLSSYDGSLAAAVLMSAATFARRTRMIGYRRNRESLPH